MLASDHEKRFGQPNNPSRISEREIDLFLKSTSVLKNELLINRQQTPLVNLTCPVPVMAVLINDIL